MWQHLLRIGYGSVFCIAGLCFGIVNAQAPETLSDPQRLEQLALEQQQTQATLKRHLQDCDTRIAVLYARQTMASLEESATNSLWQDIEILTAQCQTTTQRLRAQLTQLQAEQKKLQPAKTPQSNNP